MNSSKPKINVLLVGFQDQDNLGLRYLLSALLAEHFTAKIVSYHTDPGQLVRQVLEEKPDIVGFSLIFQYMTPAFAKVIARVREINTDVHITMGGHYPSFDYEEVLNRLPELDSIVRFEGEQTLVELVRRIQLQEDWRLTAGIAFRGEDGNVTATPLRPSVAELDSLPLPYREDIDYESSDFSTASMLGSRGCPWNCSFCSIRPFYEAQGGRLRRFRHPDAIVREMAELYRNRNVAIFLFQDDDFLGGGIHARNWAEEIADGIIRAGLSKKIAFKISCRSDEIHADNMQLLKAGGLTHVYMGVESGDEQGLASMNKHLRPEQHIRAAKILKSAGLSFDFGFMLLEPYSTFDSIRNNIDFLEAFVGDGWTVASFCRMLPYAGTPVKTRLQSEGRLLGSPFEPDYHFLDPRIDMFYQWMLATFYERNFTNTGLCHLLKSLQFEAHINLPAYQKFDAGNCMYIQHLTAVCNGIAMYTLRAAIDYFQHTQATNIRQDNPYLQGLVMNEKMEERRLTQEILAFYAGVQNKKRKAKPALASSRPGSFENSWTL